MIRKFKQWLQWKRYSKKVQIESELTLEKKEEPIPVYTREQLERVYYLGYDDGKRDGIAIAREQATKSLKEIIWQQNQSNQK